MSLVSRQRAARQRLRQAPARPARPHAPLGRPHAGCFEPRCFRRRRARLLWMKERMPAARAAAGIPAPRTVDSNGILQGLSRAEHRSAPVKTNPKSAQDPNSKRRSLGAVFGCCVWVPCTRARASAWRHSAGAGRRRRDEGAARGKGRRLRGLGRGERLQGEGAGRELARDGSRGGWSARRARAPRVCQRRRGFRACEAAGAARFHRCASRRARC